MGLQAARSGSGRHIATLPRALANCRRGAALVEFALVMPAVLALVLATLHTALIYLAQEGLETAAESAGRLIMTGQAQQGGLTQSAFKTAACNSLPPFLTCSRLYVDVTTVSNYSTAVTGFHRGGPPDVSVAHGQWADGAEFEQYIGEQSPASGDIRAQD
ncbi:hypothetical protein E4T56_gene7460 [Termitomyces sp. T112]|nr:hypothetical protein E4T56_gene7460 [Termitomyces sp. T112]